MRKLYACMPVIITATAVLRSVTADELDIQVACLLQADASVIKRHDSWRQTGTCPLSGQQRADRRWPLSHGPAELSSPALQAVTAVEVQFETHLILCVVCK